MTYKQEYRVQAAFDEATGRLDNLTWKNGGGMKDAPGDMPSYLEFHSTGALKCAIWHRNGERHRDDDLPAVIMFDNAGNPHSWDWYKDGKKHRSGGKPAVIMFFDVALTQPRCVEFFENDWPFRADGKPERYYFDPEGNATNPDGDIDLVFEGIEEGWLPKVLTAAELLPPALLNPLARKP